MFDDHGAITGRTNFISKCKKVKGRWINIMEYHVDDPLNEDDAYAPDYLNDIIKIFREVELDADKAYARENVLQKARLTAVMTQGTGGLTSEK